jgi:hypothetical protein
LITVHVGLGNDCARIPQREWANLVIRVHLTLERHAKTVDGPMHTQPMSPERQAMWRAVVDGEQAANRLRDELRWLAKDHGVPAIEWAETPEVVYLSAGEIW